MASEMTLVEQLRYYSQYDGAVFDKPLLTKRMIKAADEIERLRFCRWWLAACAFMVGVYFGVVVLGR